MEKYAILIGNKDFCPICRCLVRYDFITIKSIYVIEGNKENKVGYRHISYKSKNIVGFGVPYYN